LHDMSRLKKGEEKVHRFMLSQKKDRSEINIAGRRSQRHIIQPKTKNPQKPKHGTKTRCPFPSLQREREREREKVGISRHKSNGWLRSLHIIL